MRDGLNAGHIYENIHDPKFRLANLYYIVNKQRKKQLFQMNYAQKRLSKRKTRYAMALKARQLGVSTYFLLYYLDKVMWNENMNAVILSHDRESLEKLFRIIRFAYDNLNEEIKPKVAKGGGSKYSLYFDEINSRISVSLEARSESINLLHVSEYGLMKNKDRFNASVDAVPIESGEISIESTPKGMNHFYDDWFDDGFPYEKFFFPWYENDEYRAEVPQGFKRTLDEYELVYKARKMYNARITNQHLMFRRHKIHTKGLKSYLEEFPEDEKTCFLSSGTKVFDLLFLTTLQNEAKPIINDVDGINIFKPYDFTKQYVIGCDVAEGVQSDYSVATVYETDTREQVAIFRSNNIKPYDFAHKIKKLAGLYGYGKSHTSPKVAVERNNHGHAVLLELGENIKYDNLYYDSDDRAGWRTDRISRPIMIDTFIDGVEKKQIKLNCKETFAECFTLVDNKGKIEAMDKKHDDTVIASAIAVQMLLKHKQNLGNAPKVSQL